jgi:YjbE family integral membrane protein
LSLELLTAVLGIVVIDLTLSGDNAVVIGLAAANLEGRQRRLAVLIGVGGAVVLRVIFAAVAAMLLTIPLLQAAGGLILCWIAWKLLVQSEAGAAREHQAASSLPDAVRTIVLADAVMSLDNILAVGGASHGNIELLVFGLALSIPIVMFGSTLVASAMNRFPWLVLAGVVVLTITSGKMLAEDAVVSQYLPHHWSVEYGLMALLTVVVLALGIWTRRRQMHAAALARAEAATSESANGVSTLQ